MPHDVHHKLMQFIEISKDGYLIFDELDRISFINQTFASIIGFDVNTALGMTFEQLIRHNTATKTGWHVESDDLEAWIADAQIKRHTEEFRLLEVDSWDGRWFLLSEQSLPTNELLVHAKEITEQKALEAKLLTTQEKLRELALTDELTGIANRRSFVDSVKVELNRQDRQHTPAALLILDMDFFKRVNDTYGHQAGDEVLQQVARLIGKQLRPYDIFGRIGGEEFAIFLADTDKELAYLIAERLRISIYNTPIRFASMTLSVSASIGLCEHLVGSGFQNMYEKADIALYQAKKLGRNQVCIAVA
ncbi:sensor domain-containing diguanylate cyclase [Shewanella sp. SR44-3]|uniref:GGDEF domain-containing protein n=1 Tax=Shewanella sp. SR44-3 TaxID=2760936 RepID=UPI0015F83BFF|nr:sensor domain-containing diguanylate cyclase [Shewanella sp. SR44-3]MBB1267988.1 sensor domain-containing diguanylate cyclase [Shewanella sp. SR44-3]